MKNKGICALCLKHTFLVKSHIYPEFIYKFLYDDNHKYVQIPSDNPKKFRIRFKGIYEYLLCENCDNNIIGKNEDYASKILRSDNKHPYKKLKDDLGFLVTNVDYKKFKLFQMSLLWRSAVTTRQEIPRINLGKHYEILRNMLLIGNPGKPLEYCTTILKIPNIPKEFIGHIKPITKSSKKLDGHFVYRAIFNGLMWAWLVSSHTTSYDGEVLFLNENGDLPIINSKKYGQKYFNSMVNYLVKNIA